MAEMGFADAVRSAFSKYATFSGRARRAEFWWFALFQFLGNIAAGVLDAVVFGVSVMPPAVDLESGTGFEVFTPSVFGGAFALATIIPAISVAVRRLHDLDRSGWWWWLWLIPIVGWIVLLVWYVSRGTVGPNRFGTDPIDDQGPSITGMPRVPRP